jgi:hypothetical protein
MTKAAASVTIKARRQPRLQLRRVRRWGDPVMKSWGFDVNVVGASNFQAVRTWNDGNRTWGGVTNFLRIPHMEVMNLRNLQSSEQTGAGYFDQDSKMNWLCGYRGKVYMYETEDGNWQTDTTIRWGTVAISGNLVQVQAYETLRLSIGGEPAQDYEMARLAGFRPSDWYRPLQTLLAEGLVHRVYCAYFPDNAFGDSPKGVVYSPFFSPLDYDFVGLDQPSALYLPTIWLEPL